MQITFYKFHFRFPAILFRLRHIRDLVHIIKKYVAIPYADKKVGAALSSAPIVKIRIVSVLEPFSDTESCLICIVICFLCAVPHFIAGPDTWIFPRAGSTWNIIVAGI